MPRMQILTEAEREEFDSPPVLSSPERKRYFHIPPSLATSLATLRTETNQVLWVLRLGYFKATGRFFASRFHAADVEYVASQLGFLPGMVAVEEHDSKATASRQRQQVLDYLGYRAFGAAAERELASELRSLVRSQVRPKVLLLRMVDILKARKTEIPSVATLTEIMLRETRQHQQELTDAIEGQLSAAQRTLLEALLEKPPQAAATESPLLRYQLTLLKRFSQSTRPSRIKTNVEDLRTLRELYHQIAPVADTLDLTQEGIRYYATSVIKSEVFQIARRAEDDRYLHLVCFVTHQFFRLQDTLLDVLLTCVQHIRNGCKREHKESSYEDRRAHQRSIKTLVAVVQQGACTPLTHIERIAFQEGLPDAEKVHQIQAVLTAGKPQRDTIEHQVTQLSEQVGAAEDVHYYRLLEAKSLKLQSRVAELVKTIDFVGDDATALLSALRYYKDTDGVIGQEAPLGFLEQQEQQLVMNEAGKLRISLYKALLFLKLAEAVKAGALNVRHSYKYRSLDDYLIPKETWQRDRPTYIQRAELLPSAVCAEVLTSLAQSLDTQFGDTNRRILTGENPHLHFRTDGMFQVVTPKADTEEGEPLTNFFPEGRYISLLEVLATVNRLSGFVGDFHHWQLHHTRTPPPARTFFAGILGYGCFIGTRKIARISQWINESELENTINWYFSLDNVHAANDRILRLMDQLELPELYRRQPGLLHTSSDGQKFAVAVDSLNANYSFKYFGQDKGVSAYNFIDERHFGFHSTVFSSAEREAAYVIDGLMHNEVVKSDIHSTDTHGYSEAIFAVTHLLGFTFAPRIKNLKKQRLASFPQYKRKAYETQGFRVLPDGYINTQLIEAHWEDILRFVATIKLKETTASQLFKRLNSYSKQHPLWQALKEFGKIIKTRFILRYIDKGESANKFSRAISFGNNQEFLHGEKVEQEIAEGCQRLIKNAIICWNYLFLSQKIADTPDPQQRQRLIAAVRTGSVATWGHLNLHGEYDFSDEKLQDSVGLRIPKKLALTID